MNKKAYNVLFLIAIALGFAAPTFELVTGLCTELFFDPLPTVWHGIVYYLLPSMMLANYFLLKRPQEGEAPFVRVLSRVFVVLSVTIGLGYSIWFLPISWISVLGIVIYGLGLFGLAPVFLFVLSLTQAKLWRVKYGMEKPKLGMGWNVLFGIVLAFALVWSQLIISVSGQMLKSPKTDSKNFALFLLSRTVPENELRKSCFESYTTYANWFRMNDNRDVLKEAFFYIYGRKPGVPLVERGIRRNRFVWNYDEHMGTGLVGEPVDDLLLKESTVDVSSSFEGGNSYYEWTMVFENKGDAEAEARAVIELPPYGFVSKLSLWRDGEEYPAAFGGRSDVTGAYREVVRQYRDPVLVNQIGRDLVSVECYPVPSHGTMQIRLGITAPLWDRTRVALPRILESDYRVEPGFTHWVWIESDRPLTAVLTNLPASTKIKLRESDDLYSKPGNYFRFDGPAPDVYRFTAGLSALKYEPVQADPSVKPVLVVDGTRDVLSALVKLDWDASKYSSVIVARPFEYKVWDGHGKLSRFFRACSVGAYGGANSMAALSRALDENSTVLWLHGGLPYSLLQTIPFDQNYRRGERPRIVGVAIERGFNAFAANTGMMPYLHEVYPSGDTAADIDEGYRLAVEKPADDTGLTQVWLGGTPDSGAYFEGLPPAGQAYRIWVYSKAMEDWYADGKMAPVNVQACIQSRIVSPAVGAVVLEKQSDYEAANLDPTEGSDSILSIPEPGEILLAAVLALGAAAWMTVTIVRRRERKTGTVR